jgi:DeoR/GlpR family transcriptional regulator of sugar metabolism
MTSEVWEFAGGSVAQRIRFRRIMDMLFEKGFASVDELVDALSVSRMTVHRDLDELDSRGALRKVRGGATVGRTEQFESSWDYRARLAIDKKQAIATKALDYVDPGDSLIIDASSTVYALSKLLSTRTPLTVVTATLPVLAELAPVPSIELHSVGGEYDAHFRSFMGEHADQSARRFRVDKAFISMAAVSGTTICHSQAKAIQLNRAFFDVARTRILMVDSTKFGHSAIHVFSDASEWDLIITDSGAAPADVDALRAAGAEVVVVDVPDPGVN